MTKYFTLLLLVLLISSNSYSQNDWKLSGQVQLRTELDGRDFSNSTHPLTFASLRTRVGVEKTVSEKIMFFAQIQDSRVFGQENSLTSNSANLDLHQGYVKLINLFDWNWSVQAGRFTVAYGTERFLGASEWNYIGRAWDGVRFGFNPGFKLDVFALTQRETVGYIGSASPSNYPYPDVPNLTQSLYGFFAGFQLNELNNFEVIGFYDVDRFRIPSLTLEKPGENTSIAADDDISLKRFNLSGSYYGTFNQFSTVIEAGYQFGKRYADNISAFLFSVQGTFDLKPIKVGVGADILSGSDSSPLGTKTYSVQYGTNHKFYGSMDYFSGNPVGGLNDFYAMASIAPETSKFSGSLYVHHFMTNKELYGRITVGPGGVVSNEKFSAYGQEIDLTVKYAFIQGTTLAWGGSIFIPGDVMKLLYSGTGYTREDTGFWSYLMITASL